MVKRTDCCFIAYPKMLYSVFIIIHEEKSIGHLLMKTANRCGGN